jgi:O-acetylhomoserine (thiol)-lyase
MAAEALALTTLLQAGDHVVAAGALYGGSVTMLAVNLKKFGIETTFVDATDPDAFAAAIRPNTRALFAETLGNPSMVVLDIAAVAEVAHAHGVPLVVDNTVPSPFLCNPIALRRRHRGAQRHQVPGRPRHHAGRCGGRERHASPGTTASSPA